MLILLDCRPLQYAGSGSEKSRLIFSAVAAITGAHEVKWLLVADHQYRPEMLPDLPGASVLTRRALPGRTGWQFWYDWQIPRLARQYKADLVMVTAGIAASLPAIPQCLWMPERANPAEWDRSSLIPSIYRRRLTASLKRAAAVFCFSDRDRVWLSGRQDTPEEKTVVLQAAPAEGVASLTTAERDRVKAEYVQGKEYFLADLTGAGEKEVMNVLKAFSLFKKRQLSGMQLVFRGRMSGPSAGIRHRLETYKYRLDVHWPDEWTATAMSGLAGAAYAALFPYDGNSLGTLLLNAWKAGVPVIAVNGGLLEELADGAALGAGMGDPASLAAQLMLIYKDEALRGELIGKGFDRLAAFSRERTVNTVWESILGTTGKQIHG